MFLLGNSWLVLVLLWHKCLVKERGRISSNDDFVNGRYLDGLPAHGPIFFESPNKMGEKKGLAPGCARLGLLPQNCALPFNSLENFAKLIIDSLASSRRSDRSGQFQGNLEISQFCQKLPSRAHRAPIRKTN